MKHWAFVIGFLMVLVASNLVIAASVAYLIEDWSAPWRVATPPVAGVVLAFGECIVAARLSRKWGL